MFGKCFGSFIDDQGVLCYMYRDDSGNLTTITDNYIIVPPTANPMVQTATPMVPTATPVESPILCIFIPKTSNQVSGGAAGTDTTSLDQKGQAKEKGCKWGRDCPNKEDPNQKCHHIVCKNMCTGASRVKCYNSHWHMCPQDGKCPNKDDLARTCIHPVCNNPESHTTFNQQKKCKYGGHIPLPL